MIDRSFDAPRSSVCRAAVFVGAGRPLEMREFPRPEPGQGEALVRVECCTICGSDLHTVTGARIEPAPSILGHEILGVVDAVGTPPLNDADGRPLRIGDRIIWSTSISCGNCDRCRRGLPQKCRTLAKYGHERAEGRYALSGGLADFVLLRTGTTAIRVSPDAPAEVICPASCATATVAAAFRTAGTIDSRTVLILGAGMLGLTASAFAKSLGASSVVVCDVNARRLEQVRRFGADSTLEWRDQGKPLAQELLKESGTEAFDVVMELSGAPEAAEEACRLGNVGASVVFVGSVKKSPPIRIDPESVVRRCLSIHGLHNYVPDDLRTALAFLEQFGGVYPFAELIEFAYPLADANAAFEMAVRNRPVRTAIRP